MARMQALNILNWIPSYKFTSRIVPLSKKKGSEIVDNLKEIRPIGIMNNDIKILEKSIKRWAEDKFPKLLEIGEE